MADIDIGPGATDRASNYGAPYTFIDLANAANDTGTITSAELWFYTSETVAKIGTFYGSGTNYTYRASATLGAVTSGSKQTFTGLSIAVSEGDFLALCNKTGYIEYASSGGSGLYYDSGDLMTPGTHTYYPLSGDVISIYATGNLDITAKTSSETGSGADAKTAYPTASHSRADTGAGADLSALLAALLGAETGSGIEALLNRAIALAEIASGIENLLNRDLAAGDEGIGADLAALVKTILCAETGTVFENSYLHILEGVKTSSDTGAGDDISTELAVAHLLSDTGTAIDAVIARALFAQEYPTGAIDLVKTITAAIAGAEVGIGVELSLLSLLMQRSDSGSGSEASSLLALFTGSDIGAGAEAITLLAAMVAQDTGTSVEAVLAMFKQAIDNGVGAEVISLIGAVGRAMKLITYLRSYRDLYVYTRQYRDLKVYTNMR
jgi:hypothetical protein